MPNDSSSSCPGGRPASAASVLSRADAPADAVQRELEATLAWLRNATALDVLDLTARASREEIERARYELSKRYYAHRFSSSAEVQRLADEAFQLVQAACKTCLRQLESSDPNGAPRMSSSASPRASGRPSDAAQRAARSLRSRSLQPPRTTVSATDAASALRRELRSSESAGRRISQPAPAVSDEPSRDDLLAVARVILASNELDGARSLLEELLERHPGDLEVDMCLRLTNARAFEAAGRSKEALAAYKSVLLLDPMNEEALTATRSLRPRPATPERSSSEPGVLRRVLSLRKDNG